MENVRLSLHDQMLVHALTCLTIRVWEDEAMTKMTIGLLHGCIQGANHDHPRVEPLIRLAQAFIDADAKVGPVRRKALAWLRFEASSQLQTFHLWRMGLIRDALGTPPEAAA